jgi:cysteine desulfurase
MKHSEVVSRMGFGARIAGCAIRVSLGWTTTGADIDRFLEAWRKLAQPLLKGQEIAA